MSNNHSGLSDFEVETFSNFYIPLKFSDYLHQSHPSKNNNKNNFDKIIETSPEALLNAVTGIQSDDSTKLKDYSFFRNGSHKINGLLEVLNNLVNSLYQAKTLTEQNKIPLVTLIGPTGSGKTTLGDSLEKGLVNYLQSKPAYYLVIKDGDKRFPCPYFEEPINVLATNNIVIPNSLRREYIIKDSAELCPHCSSLLNELFTKKVTGENNYTGWMQVFDDLLEARRLTPRSASLELTDKDFKKKFPLVVRNANRGLLHISIDDTNIREIPQINYQLLLKLADKQVVLNDGRVFKPDLTVLLYSNESILMDLAVPDNITMKDFESPRYMPLLDRMLPVFVRRNLSYTCEEDIYKRANLPFDHFWPHSLSSIARFSVSTRIGNEEEDTETDLARLLELYDKFEKMQVIQSDDLKFIKQRLNLEFDEPPVDGWSSGLSTRKANSELIYLSKNNKRTCLTPLIVDEFLTMHEDEFEDNINLIKKHNNNKMLIDLTVGYLSMLNEKKGGLKYLENEFSEFYSLYEKKLMKNIEFIETIKGREKIDDVLQEIATKKLNLGVGAPENLANIIFDFRDKTGKPMQFIDLVEKNSELIKDFKSFDTFIDWNNYKRTRKPSGDDELKFKRLLNSLKDLKYCDNCSKASIDALIEEELIG